MTSQRAKRETPWPDKRDAAYDFTNGRAHDCPTCLAKAGVEVEEGGDDE